MTDNNDLTLHNDFRDYSLSPPRIIWNHNNRNNVWDEEHEKFFGYSETHVSQADSIFLNSRQERYKDDLHGKIPWNKSTPMRDSRDILNMR